MVGSDMGRAANALTGWAGVQRPGQEDTEASRESKSGKVSGAIPSLHLLVWFLPLELARK